MSVRNSAENKRLRSLERETRKMFHSPSGKTDLIAWVKMRERVSTGKAVRMILTGCLKVDSHTLGRDSKGHFQRYVPAEQGRRIRVVMPESLK